MFLETVFSDDICHLNVKVDENAQLNNYIFNLIYFDKVKDFFFNIDWNRYIMHPYLRQYFAHSYLFIFLNQAIMHTTIFNLLVLRLFKINGNQFLG